MLVNVPSLEVPSMLRVEPGNPDDSYLIQKIEGTAAVGGRMPLGGQALPPDTIAAIRQWITDGAVASAAARSAWPRPSSGCSRPRRRRTFAPKTRRRWQNCWWLRTRHST